MGVPVGAADLATERLTDAMLDLVVQAATPAFGYVIVDEIDFRCGDVIAKALSRGSRFALFVATIGSGVDRLLHSLQQSDMVSAFVADAVASETVESVARCAAAAVESTLSRGEHISNSYSPGYCGWALTEQRKLFAHFPSSPCSVSLNDSCLMTPIKSVSGVLAIGTEVVKAPYGCAICTKTDCYKKQIRKSFLA